MIQISEAEGQIMEVVWRDGQAGADAILREVGEPNGWAETTTRTLRRISTEESLIRAPGAASGAAASGETKGLADPA